MFKIYLSNYLPICLPTTWNFTECRTDSIRQPLFICMNPGPRYRVRTLGS